MLLFCRNNISFIPCFSSEFDGVMGITFLRIIKARTSTSQLWVIIITLEFVLFDKI